MLSEYSFHHIGVATNSIVNTSRYYEDLGFLISETIFDPIQSVNICFLYKTGHPSIELIEPISDLSPVAKFLQKMGGVTPYHFCYEVKSIEEAIATMKKMKFVSLSKPVIAIAMQNRLICFLYNKEVGLIELVQSK